MQRSLFARLTQHIPPGQFARYLLIGIWNTAFGYSCFALFTAVLDRYMPASYMAGSLLSWIVNVTVSFLGYKWFVFKTKGNYFREWVRCLMVYSGGIALGLALLPPTVFLVSYLTGNPRTAPYIAGALLLGLQVVLSFLGHSKFSFATAPLAPDSESRRESPLDSARADDEALGPSDGENRSAPNRDSARDAASRRATRPG